MADFIDWNTPYKGVGRNATELAYQKAGYTGSFGQGAAKKWGMDNFGTDDYTKFNAAPGVKPLNTASQNTYQQNALYNMGQPSTPVNPHINASYGNADTAIGQAAKPYDPNSYKQFQNPFIEDVIGRNAANISRTYKGQHNNIDQQFAAAGGYGAESQGVEHALTNEAESRQIGDMDALLRSGSYDNAVANALGLYKSDQGNALQRAGAYGNLGASYQNSDQYGRNVQATDENRQLAAGDRIQQQNQNELDAFFAERDRAAEYPNQQIERLKSILAAYPTGTTQTSSTPGVGVAQGALGGGILGSAIGKDFDWASLFGGGNSGTYDGGTRVGQQYPLYYNGSAY